ncbi:MAG: N-acylglucosamine 2-epimerase [Clostridiales bacterium]|nr:N-acylglucosamine 2-epimerase [Clostridiales bacterium]
MDKRRLDELHNLYSTTLFNDVIPFWEKYSMDTEYGGYLHYVDRDGSLLCDDKSVWFQGRTCWLFSRLYNTVEKKQSWLENAKLGYDFLCSHCFDSRGRMYFTVTKDGKPLQMRRYYFSETFAIIAFFEYSRASGDKEALQRGRDLFSKVMGYYRNPDPAIFTPKIDPNTRNLIGHSYPMILIATAQIARECDPDNPIYQDFIDECIKELLTKFVKPEYKALLEFVTADGEIFNSPTGRTINPGHAIETSWFLMHEGIHTDDKELIGQAVDILDWSFERGWDKEYGGLFNFVDLDGKPPEKIEWDMKYWWPHTEALYASLLAHHLTGKEQFGEMYEKIHEFTFGCFPDPEYGEWYGYLHRDGSVCLPIKGSMFKGAFHLPRQLLYGIKLIDKMGTV